LLTQRTLDVRGKVHVAGRIDDINPVIAPEAGRRSRRDRDAALLFLLHPVHHGRSFVNLTNLVGDARVEQDPFRRGGLAGIDVRHDADVARPVQWYLSGHCLMAGSEDPALRSEFHQR
jgi:hypothetical protein